MPINQEKMKALQEQYGKEEGKQIYYKMEQVAKKKHKASYSGYKS